MAFHGSRTAVVTVVEDTDGEYLRIDIQEKCLTHGVAYLCFPTLSWRFWETHPFSVAFQSCSDEDHELGQTFPSGEGAEGAEKSVGGSKIAPVEEPPVNNRTHATTTFFTRCREGLTSKLAGRITAAQTRLRVLIEGPYDHSGRVPSQLAQCSGVLCIAGGVGITPCLPYLSRGGTTGAKLFWSVRKQGLATALAPVLSALPSSIRVETVVGQRLDLDSILRQEMEAKDEGPLAIVVCGPSGMADDVRQKVVSLARANPLSRPYVLLDEAFSW